MRFKCFSDHHENSSWEWNGLFTGIKWKLNGMKCYFLRVNWSRATDMRLSGHFHNQHWELQARISRRKKCLQMDWTLYNHLKKNYSALLLDKSLIPAQLPPQLSTSLFECTPLSFTWRINFRYHITRGETHNHLFLTLQTLFISLTKTTLWMMDTKGLLFLFSMPPHRWPFNGRVCLPPAAKTGKKKKIASGVGFPNVNLNRFKLVFCHVFVGFLGGKDFLSFFRWREKGQPYFLGR